jgi:NADPH:quinone reductase-like Zn-dependent oxidoreductase
MRAAIVNSFGEAPALGDFAAPNAGPGQVVVDVTLAGLNPVDRLRAEGYDYLNAVTPFVAGHEGVGMLNGKRVYFNEAVEPYGSFARQALVQADRLLTVPVGLADEQAIPLGIAGLTAWSALTYDAGLAAGERVLVTGATGMVGQIATQAAKLLGASYVVAAGRHKPTLTSLLDRGADRVVVLGDDRSGAIAGVAGNGFDVVVDCVYGTPFVAALDATAPGARVVIVGLAAGTSVTLEFFSLFRRRISCLALGDVPPTARQEAFNALADHSIAGRLRVDGQCYQLDDVTAAWQELVRGAHRKLMIAP